MDCMHDVNTVKRIPFLGPTKIVHYREGVLWSGVIINCVGYIWDSVSVHYRGMRGVLYEGIFELLMIYFLRGVVYFWCTKSLFIY